MRHIISILLENESGALSRVANMFSARGFNIDSLTVGRTEDPNLSRMTIVVKGDDAILAAVLGSDHGVKSWVYGHQLEVSDASFAFERAAGL